MTQPENIEKLIKKLRYDAGPEMYDRIFDNVLQAQEQSKEQKSAAIQPNIWRIIMKTKIAKLGIAAVIIIAVGLTINLLDKFVPSAYAITQTIEAFEELSYVHVRLLKPPAESGQDTWLEFDENGKVVRARIEEGEDENFRIMVWANDTIYWFSPPQNKFVKMHETRFAAKLEQMRFMIDPKVAVQSLYDMHLDKKVELNVNYPEGNDELIVLTAIAKVPLKEMPRGQGFDKQVLLIDPETKLAVQRETYNLKDGEYKLFRHYEFLEYNKPIDEEMFVLEPLGDVELEDRTAGIGMPQGNMTDIEAARELVRQYTEALIAKDYAKAGKLYNGQSEAEVREWNQEKLKIKHIRVIGIGEPVAKPERGQRNYGVPFAHLIELSDGRLEISGPWGGKAWSKEAEANLDIQSCRQAIVRPVVGQPDRWVITGGI